MDSGVLYAKTVTPERPAFKEAVTLTSCGLSATTAYMALHTEPNDSRLYGGLFPGLRMAQGLPRTADTTPYLRMRAFHSMTDWSPSRMLSE
eukprot:10274014-Alexandrium_andersonii.AAC.1